MSPQVCCLWLWSLECRSYTTRVGLACGPPRKRRAAVLTPDLRAWPYVEPGCRNVISLQEVVLEQGGPLTPRES